MNFGDVVWPVYYREGRWNAAKEGQMVVVAGNNHAVISAPGTIQAELATLVKKAPNLELGKGPVPMDLSLCLTANLFLSYEAAEAQAETWNRG